MQLLALPHELFGARAFSQENGTGAKNAFWEKVVHVVMHYR